MIIPIASSGSNLAEVIKKKIRFENTNQITKVLPLLSFIWRKMTICTGFSKKIIVLSILSLSVFGMMWCTSNKIVEKGNTVTVDYIGKLQDWTVFDTSIESVAKENGKYQSGRNYTEGLSFEVGAGQMIVWFDKGVEGMKVEETKTVEIAAKDAYGERDTGKLLTVAKDQITWADQYEVGMQVMSQNGQVFKVYKVNKDDIVFDANHELAGKTLIFDITVKSVKK